MSERVQSVIDQIGRDELSRLFKRYSRLRFVREIGIRKAIGASTLDIFVQIIVESTVISVLGGIAGIGASYALVQIIAMFTPTDNTPVITFSAIGMAFLFSVAVGMLAGLYPAVRASRLHPIQALKYD